MSERRARSGGGRRYGVFFGSGRGIDAIEHDEFDTLAEANAVAARLLAGAQARHGGRIRRLSRSPLRAIVYDGRNDPIRIWVERVAPGTGMVRYRVSGVRAA
jgi:hypothetical protein